MTAIIEAKLPDLSTTPRGRANAVCNRDEARVAGEAYDLYVFLHRRPSMAPNRKKDVIQGLAAIAAIGGGTT